MNDKYISVSQLTRYIKYKIDNDTNLNEIFLKGEIYIKTLDKIALVLFSSVILIISVIFCLVIFGWINIDIITLYIKHGLNNPVITNVTLGVLTVFILFAIKGIFFTSDSKDESSMENGILIQNENGKLLISKDTIQNLVSGVVKEVETS